MDTQLLRMEGGADAVAQAVAVAVAARDTELAGLQRHAAELEGHLESVMHEAQEVQQESLDMRDHVVQLEAALRESEAKKCGLTLNACLKSAFSPGAQHESMGLAAAVRLWALRDPWPGELHKHG